MFGLNKLTIKEALKGLEKGDFTAVELTEQHIKEIENNRGLNAFIVDNFDQALVLAKQADENVAKGSLRKLEGIPVGVKDLFCTEGVLSTSCSHILDGFKPKYESTVTSKLFDSGAIMIGKTNMDEFAMGSANETSFYGPVINPWKDNEGKKRVPGGSSGGSAAAVSANLCMGALGSDTGGSIRQPASFCGNVGVKPTYGRCSRWGMIAFASSLDQAGVFTRSVEDAALVLETICGHDEKDSTSTPMEVPDFSKAVASGVKGLKIGIPKEYQHDAMSDEISSLWQKGRQMLREAGAEIVDVSLPHTKYALPAYYIVAPAEASANLSRYDGVRYGLRVFEDGMSLDDMYEATRSKGFGDEVKRRLMIGTYVLSSGYYDAYYKKAQRIRTLIAQDFDNAFKKCDALLTPTTPTEAFQVGQKLDPLNMYLNDVFTVPASLAGLPGISVPCGLSDNGLPLGLQIISNSFDEESMFKVAGSLEKTAGFKGLYSDS